MKSNTFLSRISLAGLELGIAVAAGVVGGLFLDRRFDTGPWLMIGGLLLGVGSGFYNLYRLALVSVEGEDHEEPPPGDEGRPG